MKENPELARFLKDNRMKMTGQREKILRFLLKWQKHLSPEELFHELRKKYPTIGRATVYRTLKILARANIAADVHFGDGAKRFEHNRKHHDHLICTRCKRSIEFFHPEIERLQEQVVRRHGFMVERHRLEIYGLCHDCAKE